IQPHGRALGLYWLAQPLSGAPARWWSPSVLWDRGDQGKAALGARAGGGFPDWARHSCNVDDLRNLQRHPASRRTMDGFVGRLQLSRCKGVGLGEGLGCTTGQPVEAALLVRAFRG